MSRFAVIVGFTKKYKGKDKDTVEILNHFTMILKGKDQAREQTAVLNWRKRNDTYRNLENSKADTVRYRNG